MAAFVVGDVTYAMVNQRKMSDSRNMNRVRLTFGASSETYATGGIPLSIGNLGCPTVVESLIVVDKGQSGYNFMYDQSASKLVMFVAPSHSHTLTITKGTANLSMGISADSAAATINVSSIATSLSLTAPIAAASFASSGMDELANGTDIAVQTIEVEVIGW